MRVYSIMLSEGEKNQSNLLDTAVLMISWRTKWSALCSNMLGEGVGCCHIFRCFAAIWLYLSLSHIDDFILLVENVHIQIIHVFVKTYQQTEEPLLGHPERGGQAKGGGDLLNLHSVDALFSYAVREDFSIKIGVVLIIYVLIFSRLH